MLWLPQNRRETLLVAGAAMLGMGVIKVVNWLRTPSVKKELREAKDSVAKAVMSDEETVAKQA